MTYRILAVASLTLLAACGGSVPTPGENLRVSVAAMTARSPGDRMVLNVTPASVSTDLDYDDASGRYKGALRVPPGKQKLTVSALHDINGDGQLDLVGSGDAEATVLADRTTSVFIQILDASGPPDLPDHSPVITSVQISRTDPSPGEPIELTATAVDPDGDPIAWAWSATCEAGANGSFSDAAAAATTWTGEAAGLCSFTVQATANGRSYAMGFEVTVSKQPGDVAITVEFVTQPYIAGFTLWDSAGGAFCDVPRDPTADATCIASDVAGAAYLVVVTADGNTDASLISMADDCGGSFELVSASGSVAAFNWTSPLAPGFCMITASVERSGLGDAFPIAVYVQ